MSRLISDLHPLVQGLCHRHIVLCGVEGIDLLVTSTYRSIEEQDALYAQGRTTPGKIVTKARGGQSWHNYRCAYDVVPVKGGKAIWNDAALWDRIGALGEKVGLEWAGRWKTFRESPHFQYTFGMTLSELKAGKPLPTAT